MGSFRITVGTDELSAEERIALERSAASLRRALEKIRS
jgi:hypothetical protein